MLRVRYLSELNNSNLEVRHHVAKYWYFQFRDVRRPFTIEKGGNSNFETRNPRSKIEVPDPSFGRIVSTGTSQLATNFCVVCRLP
jgi:hypothetical protein